MNAEQRIAYQLGLAIMRGEALFDELEAAKERLRQFEALLATEGDDDGGE